MNINTKQYIEKYIKIRDKAGKIIDFKLNKPQQKLYNVIKEQKQQNKPVTKAEPSLIVFSLLIRPNKNSVNTHEIIETSNTSKALRPKEYTPQAAAGNKAALTSSILF